MPPYVNPYSSVLDGSLRVESSTNSDRYGKGSLIVENGCEFFGSQNQFVKSTHVNADLTIESAKNLLASAKAVTITASTGAVGINSTAGSVTLSGISASLTAITGSVSVVGGTSASLTSTTGNAYVLGKTAASVTADTGPASLIATSGTVTVQAAQTMFLFGATKQETFGNVLASSTTDYSISSTTGNAIFNANNGEARVFGKTLASVIGHEGVKIEATGGNSTVKASGIVYLEGATKQETFGTVNATSTGNYAITSSTGKVQLNATGAAGAVELFGKTNVYVKGTDLTTIESSGTVTLVGPNVNTSATHISSTGSNSITLTAPSISLSGSTISKVEAPTVEIGKTSDTVTISRAGQDTNVQGKLSVTQHTNLSTLNTSGDCTIGGNLTVSGSVTNIDTQNLLVKDNIIVLNSADAAGRDAGMVFAATGALSTALYYKNSESAFVFSTTESSSATGPVLIAKDYSDIKCRNITASYITLTNFGTKEFQLDGRIQNQYITIPDINKTRGSYEFQIESVSNGGSVYNYKIVKSGTDTGLGATGPDGFIPAKSVSSSFGVHTEGDDGSQVWVRWESDKVPEFYMKNISKNIGMLTFRVNYITVG
jgi:hypothetical protein